MMKASGPHVGVLSCGLTSVLKVKLYVIVGVLLVESCCIRIRKKTLYAFLAKMFPQVIILSRSKSLNQVYGIV